MGSRWRQENHYRYARIHFNLDSHDTYRVSDDDQTRMVPNPAKTPAYQRVEKARRALDLVQTARDRELLAVSSPPPGSTTVVTNAMINTINADTHTAHGDLDAELWPRTRRYRPGCHWQRSTPASKSWTPKRN